MKEIELFGKHGLGKVALVDDESYESLCQYRWNAQPGGETFYASASIHGQSVFMHKLILDLPSSQKVDHVNGNGLDNQKHNLRPCTHAENMRNRRKYKITLSKYLGVTWNKQDKKWRARVEKDGENYSAGQYFIEEQAAYARDLKAKELFGEFACLNFSDEQLSLLRSKYQRGIEEYAKQKSKTDKSKAYKKKLSPHEQKKKYNLVFYGEHLAFLEAEALKNNCTIPQVVRSLIDEKISP